MQSSQSTWIGSLTKCEDLVTTDRVLGVAFCFEGLFLRDLGLAVGKILPLESFLPVVRACLAFSLLAGVG